MLESTQVSAPSPILRTLSTPEQTKQALMKDILVLEDLIITYSRIDRERIPALEERLRVLEYKLLDVMVTQNDEWLEMFKEQNC